MDDADRARGVRVGEIRVELRELVGAQQSLVDDGLRGEAGDVELAARGDIGGGDGALDEAAQQKERALERVGREAAARDEELADRRHGAPRDLAERALVDRHVAPAEGGEAALGDDAFDDRLACLTIGERVRQEAHPDAVLARTGERDA